MLHTYMGVVLPTNYVILSASDLLWHIWKLRTLVRVSLQFLFSRELSSINQRVEGLTVLTKLALLFPTIKLPLPHNSKMKCRLYNRENFSRLGGGGNWGAPTSATELFFRSFSYNVRGKERLHFTWNKVLYNPIPVKLKNQNIIILSFYMLDSQSQL